MGRYILILAVIAGCLYAVISGSGNGNDEPKGPAPKYLRYNNSAEPQSLDPQVATGVPDAHIIDCLYEGLIHLSGPQLKPSGAAAASWTISEDNLTYTFQIRKAHWSNGDPVTAQDFVDSWHRMLRLDPVSDYVGMLYVLKGAKDYADRKTDDFSTVGVKATDEKTLVVTLAGPTPYFLEALAHHAFFPVHDAMSSFKSTAAKFSAGALVGNGPYKLKEHHINAKILVVRNDRYWDAANVKLDGIEFYPIDNHETALLMFQNGDLDWIDEVPLSSLPILIKNNDPNLHLNPYFGTYYYRFNVTKEPFNDVRVRQAFCMAVDKKRITEIVTGAGEVPTNTMVPMELGEYLPDGLKDYRGPAGIGYDPEKAKKLLADAGYGAGGKAFPVVEILYNNNENHKKVALEVAQMLKLTLGVEVKLLNKEWKVYLQDMSDLKFDMARSGWIGDYSDPNTFLEIYQTGDGNNRTGWSNGTFDRLIQQAGATADPAQRLILLAEAEAILCNDEVPILPVYTYINKKMISQRVGGVVTNVRDITDWKALYIKE